MAALLLLGAGPGGSKAKDDFWGDLADPGRKKYRAALKKGIEYYNSATSRRGHLNRALLEQLLQEGTERDAASLRRRALTRAAVLFREAVAASPGRARGHEHLGKAAYHLAHLDRAAGQSGPRHDLKRMKEAVAALERARSLDATIGESYDTTNMLGIAHFTLGQLERAVLEFDRAERSLTSGGGSSSVRRGRRSLLLGNSAECLMGLGRLNEAIQRYREALTLGGGSRLENSHHWGLAVAYDRDEQPAKAMAHARRAVARDKSMSALTSNGTFFIPAGEVHYYRAMGHLALGQVDRARQELTTFLEDLPGGQWAPQARARLAQLGGQGGGVALAGKKKRLAPVPGAAGVAQEEQARARYKLKVRGQLSRIRRCYTAALRKDRRLGGKVRVAFQVGKKGKALRLKVLTSTFKDAGLQRCLFTELRAINFRAPSRGKPVALKYTFDFRPMR